MSCMKPSGCYSYTVSWRHRTFSSADRLMRIFGRLLAQRRGYRLSTRRQPHTSSVHRGLCGVSTEVESNPGRSGGGRSLLRIRAVIESLINRENTGNNFIPGVIRGSRPLINRRNHPRVGHSFEPQSASGNSLDRFDRAIRRLEFLTQGLSFMWSLSHAYEPGLTGLMLGGKDRSC